MFTLVNQQDKLFEEFNTLAVIYGTPFEKLAPPEQKQEDGVGAESQDHEPAENIDNEQPPEEDEHTKFLVINIVLEHMVDQGSLTYCAGCEEPTPIGTECEGASQCIPTKMGTNLQKVHIKQTSYLKLI